MTDLIMLALVVVCFTLATAYAVFCDQTLAPGSAEDVTP